MTVLSSQPQYRIELGSITRAMHLIL